MKPQFGNPEQIEKVRDYQAMIEGRIPVTEGELQFWDYSEGNGCVLFPWDDHSKADQLRLYCDCIKCSEVVEFIKHYDHHQHYDCMCKKFDNVKCKCGLEYEVDNIDQVWVKNN